jgi:hypothetical protein
MRNNRFKAVFVLFILVQSQGLLSAPVCSDLFGKIYIESASVSDYLESFKNEILKIDDSEVLTGSKKPDWHQYNHLKNILTAAKIIHHKNAEKKFNSSEIEILKNDLKDWALRHHQITVDLTATPELIKFIDTNHGYFNLYSRINMAVGLNIFPTKHLELVPQTKELLKDAEKTVASNQQAISELYESTGHKTKNSYLKYVKNYSARAKNILDLVQNNLVIAIHRPENARFWIPISGFQNQRTTGSSNGAMDPYYRNQVESNLTFQDTAKYSEKSVRYMPNYGEARPEQGYKELLPNTGADRYGSDLWIVKKELYESRATWTPRDSFGQSRVTSRKQATLWDQMFVPWTARELMVPFALNSEVYHAYGSTAPKTKLKPFSPSSVPENFILKGSKYGSSYFEAQIWGPLTLDDIQAFHFKSNPPDKELFDLLVSKGIEIWDERTWPAKKYKGAESI